MFINLLAVSTVTAAFGLCSVVAILYLIDNQTVPAVLNTVGACFWLCVLLVAIFVTCDKYNALNEKYNQLSDPLPITD